jgi:hypothetical protein
MRRRLFHVASAVSLLLLVAVAKLWAWTQIGAERWVTLDPFRETSVTSVDGRVIVVWMDRAVVGLKPTAFQQLGVGGVGLRRWEFPGGLALRQVIVPHWLLCLAVGVLPAAWTYRHLRARPVPPGHCRRCGYDLRASPARCPECGEAAPAAAG